MNERIKQLAQQAGIGILYEYDGYDGHAGVCNFDDIEKFAQLIVEECMNQVREQYVPVLEDEAMMQDTHWDGYVQCGVDSVVGIREYFFGVEDVDV